MRRGGCSVVGATTKLPVQSLPAPAVGCNRHFARDDASHPDLQLICLCGPPRSGTTWLQRLLGSSQQVVTGQESFLFAQYLVPQLWAFRWGAARTERGGLGLAAYMTEAEFVEALRQQALSMLAAMTEAVRPAGRQPHIFVDKTPPAALITREILTILPNARFLMMTRDPLDVVASWRRSCRTWAPWMGSARVVEVARTVASYLAAVDRARDELGPGVVKVIAYEDLFANPVAQLRSAIDFIGIDTSSLDLAQIVSDNSAARIRQGDGFAIPLRGESIARGYRRVLEPAGFIGPARPGDGVQSMSLLARWRVRRIARVGRSTTPTQSGRAADPPRDWRWPHRR